MSLFYKYANGSVVNTREAADADNMHLTSTAEPVASDNQKESVSEHH